MLFGIWRVVKKMNRRILTMVAMLPAAFAGMLLAGGNRAGGQLATTISPLSVIQGPVEADVFRVLDGDTFLFTAYPFPEVVIRGTLRMDGVDTPELKGRCSEEKKKAAEATAFLKNAIEANKGRVTLHVVGLVGSDGGGFGRYRAVAKVKGNSLSDMMIEKGHARVNRGEARKSWCDGSS